MKFPCDEAPRDSAAGVQPCPQGSRVWILVATILGSSLAFIDSTVVNVALPAVQNSFHATVVDVQWVVESYGLFLSALILAGGSLGDLLGRRRMFIAGIAIFSAASVGCGIAATIQQLIIARSIQGVGAALLVPGSLAIISTSFAVKSRGQAIGTWSGFTAITTAVGPVLGGWLVQHASWRWVFFINLPIALAVILISFWHVPESRSEDASARHIDWLGTTLVTAGLGGLIGGLIESANLGWSSPIVLGALIAGGLSIEGFFLVESRVASPMLPLTLFRSRNFTGANIFTLLLYSAIGIFFFLFPLNLIQVQGYSSTATGAAILPLILLMFVLSRWSGGLVARFGPTLPLIIGPLIVALGFALFALPSVGASYWWSYFPAIMMLGFGLAVTVAPLTTVVMSSLDQEKVGTASGVNNAVARVAGVLAIAVLGIVMVKAFSFRLDRDLTQISVSPEIIETLHKNEIQLAGIQVPAELGSGQAAAVRKSIENSFVFGFRIVILISAGLALAAAAVAKSMISSSPDKAETPLS